MWIPVAHLSEFEGDRKVVEVPGERQPVLLLEVGGMVYAIADVCTHDGNLLSDGELEGFFLRCSRHGARFDIRTGRATLPAPRPVRTYPTRLEGGTVWIEVPDGRPSSA